MSKIVYNNTDVSKNKSSTLHRLYKKKNIKHIRWTFITTKNNIFCTLYSSNTIKTLTKSAGSIGITNNKKNMIVFRYLIKIFSLFLNTNNTKISVVFRRQLTNMQKKKLLINMNSTKLHICYFYNFLTYSHGGTKLAKKRRL
jgi:hypothetical protein